MSKVLIKNSTLTNIAEAIRDHGQGNTSLMKPSEMPEYIANIDAEKVTVDGVKVNEKLDLSIPEVQNDLIIMLDKNPLNHNGYSCTIHSILPNGNIIATYYSDGDKMLVYDSEKESIIIEDISIEDLTIITSDNEIYAYTHYFFYNSWFILYKLNFETKKFEVCKTLTNNNPGKSIIYKPIIFNNKFVFMKKDSITTVNYNIKFTVGVIEIDNNTSSQPVYFDVMQPYDSNLTDRYYTLQKFFVLDKHLYYYLCSGKKNSSTIYPIHEQYFGRFNEQITAKDTEIIVNNPIQYMSNIYVFDNQIMGYKASGFRSNNFILYRLVNNQWETVLDTFKTYTYQVNNVNDQPLYFYTYTGCYSASQSPMGSPQEDNYLSQYVLNMYLYTLNYNTNSFDEIVFNYMPWYYDGGDASHHVSVEPYMIKYLNNNTILVKCKFHSKVYNNDGPYYKIIKSLDNSPVFYLKNN